MNKIEFIRKEVEQYISDNISTRKTKIDVASDMPSFEGFAAWILQREMYGEKLPVDVMEMYANSEMYEPVYTYIIIETVTK